MKKVLKSIVYSTSFFSIIIIFLLVLVGIVEKGSEENIPYISMFPGVDSEDVKSKIQLPSYPSGKERNKTYLGVNSNPEKNLIRDDIEYEMAMMAYPNMRAIAFLYKAAELDAERFMAYEKGDYELVNKLTNELFLYMFCNDSYYKDPNHATKRLRSMLTDTPERRLQGSKMDKISKLPAFVGGNEYEICAKLETPRLNVTK